MPVFRSRAFAGPQDLVRMQDLARHQWAAWRAGGHAPGIHVGDLDWWMAQLPRERDPATAIRLWFGPGHDTPVAWGWIHDPAGLDVQVHPEHEVDALRCVLDWFEAAPASRARTASTRRSPLPEEGKPAVWAFTPDPRAGAELAARGYAQVAGDRGAFVHTMLRLRLEAEPAGAVTLPLGYRLRIVGGDVADHARRVEVHRAAFAPSRFTVERYAKVRGASSYRPELDVVVEAPDGSFAAFCLCWLDEANGVGELEPVGTHPGHRRMGLATAACRGALDALAATGADAAVVLHEENGAAGALYASLGFREFGRSVRFERVTGR